MFSSLLRRRRAFSVSDRQARDLAAAAAIHGASPLAWFAHTGGIIDVDLLLQEIEWARATCVDRADLAALKWLDDYVCEQGPRPAPSRWIPAERTPL